MVDVNLHTGSCQVVARTTSSEDTHWISFRSGDGSEITIFGKSEHADAFRMMADIFNDAFAKLDPERETFTAAQRAEFEAADIPF